MRPLLTTEAAQRYLAELGIEFSTYTLKDWRYQGRGPAFVKISTRVLYRPEDLEAWVQQKIEESQRIAR